LGGELVLKQEQAILVLGHIRLLNVLIKKDYILSIVGFSKGTHSSGLLVLLLWFISWLDALPLQALLKTFRPLWSAKAQFTAEVSFCYASNQRKPSAIASC